MFQDQILIDFVTEGFRIQLTDKEESSMFALGESKLNPWAREVINMATENIQDLPKKIAIKGHTESIPFTSGKTTNWELSNQRASGARIQFKKNGIDPERFSRIVDYAHTLAIITEGSTDPHN